MTEAYRADLAHIHDTGFGRIALNAAPVLLDALRKGGVERGLVIDLGCGGGLLSKPLADAGYDVLGIDLSAAMLAIAQQRVPTGRFVQGSALTAELPPCVAVTAVGEVLNYLFDPGNNAKALHGLLRRIYAALAPGGLFLCDLVAPGRVPGRGPQWRWFEGDGWIVLVKSEEDRKRRLLTRHITSFRRVGELYRRDDEEHPQRLLTRAEMTGPLRRLGFRVRTLRGYGPLRFGRGAFGVLARKP